MRRGRSCHPINGAKRARFKAVKYAFPRNFAEGLLNFDPYPRTIRLFH